MIWAAWAAIGAGLTAITYLIVQAAREAIHTSLEQLDANIAAALEQDDPWDADLKHLLDEAAG